MIDPGRFGETVQALGVGFFAGVPDSLLKEWCSWILESVPADRHVIAANEGGAIGVAAGWHIATGEVPLVYLQNSGMGNVVNPLISLADSEVYRIPMLLVIGWRGEPGRPDEPQHVRQGKVTLPTLEAIGVPHEVLPMDEAGAMEALERVVAACRDGSRPHALVVRGGSFSKFGGKAETAGTGPMPGREEAIGWILAALGGDTAVVATTGMISREVYETRSRWGGDGARDFLVVGSMGHASQIALGMALARPRQAVCCLDGDGAMLMHMGGMAIIGARRPDRFIHVVLNNGAHDSVGGQPTVALGMNLPALALACGYRTAVTAGTGETIRAALGAASKSPGPHFIEVRVARGNRADLGRPKGTPAEAKRQFMAHWYGKRND